MVGLGDLPGGDFGSDAHAVSIDGAVVVGGSVAGENGWSAAFVWEEGHGMRSLEYVLANDCGLDLTGWWLMEAMDVSADGTTIVGYGINPDGQTEAWIATIPEPTTLSVLALGGFALLRRRRG